MWARIGSLFILSKHLGNASQVWVVGVVRARVCVVARKRRPGGVWAVGVVRARGGCGHALAAFKYSLNTQKMQPGVGSGEAGVVWCGR